MQEWENHTTEKPKKECPVIIHLNANEIITIIHELTLRLCFVLSVYQRLFLILQL